MEFTRYMEFWLSCMIYMIDQNTILMMLGWEVLCYSSLPPHLSQTTSSAYDGCTDDFDGTSAATPLASGVIALVLEVK